MTDGTPPGSDDRYGWLGGKQRSADALAGVLLMGVRLYDPATGRFWSPDSVPGGNATPYDYCSADPVKCSDLTGKWGWGDLLDAVAVVAEVVATVVPGPIGAIAGAVSAGAYAARGNYSRAAEMAVTAAAAMVGAGAVVRGAAAARSAGQVAARVGRSHMAPSRAPVRAAPNCSNSFTPDTPVQMADGSTQPISAVAVGDLVAAPDPRTDKLTAQPVLAVIVGYGDKHLIGVTTLSLASADEAASTRPGTETWVATANHPIWVEGEGWTDADELAVGELLEGVNGELRVVQSVEDRGWIAEQSVYNLSVGNSHTFVVGHVGGGAAVHNCSSRYSASDALDDPQALNGLRPSHVDDLARNAGYTVRPGKTKAANPATRYYKPGTRETGGFRILPNGVPGQPGCKAGAYVRFFGGKHAKKYARLE